MPSKRPFGWSHASALRFYFGEGLMRVYPRAIDWKRHGDGLTTFGAPAVYEPPDGDIAARFGHIDRALFRLPSRDKAALALAYGDEGEHFERERPGSRAWAVAALGEQVARQVALAREKLPAAVERLRTARARDGRSDPADEALATVFAGGEPRRVWARLFYEKRLKPKDADLVRQRLLVEARGTLELAEDRFAEAFDRIAADRRALRHARLRNEAA